MFMFNVLPASYMHASWWQGPFIKLQVSESHTVKKRWFSLSQKIIQVSKIQSYPENPWPYELQKCVLLPKDALEALLLKLASMICATHIATLVLAPQVQQMKALIGESSYKAILELASTNSFLEGTEENMLLHICQFKITNIDFDSQDVKHLTQQLLLLGAQVLGALYAHTPKSFRDRAALKLPLECAPFFQNDAFQLDDRQTQNLNTTFEHWLRQLLPNGISRDDKTS